MLGRLVKLDGYRTLDTATDGGRAFASRTAPTAP